MNAPTPHSWLARLYLFNNTLGQVLRLGTYTQDEAVLSQLDSMARSRRLWLWVAGASLLWMLLVWCAHSVALQSGPPPAGSTASLSLMVHWAQPGWAALLWGLLVPPLLGLLMLDGWFSRQTGKHLYLFFTGYHLSLVVYPLTAAALRAGRQPQGLTLYGWLAELPDHGNRWFLNLGLLLLFGLVIFLVVVRGRREHEAKLRLQEQAELERAARQVAEAEYKLLQAQIEPHFLFNTLGALQHRAEGKAPEAAALASDLVRFLRGSMQTLRADQTTLKEDFALAEAYLGIMQARMGDRLRYRVALPSELAGLIIPSMMVLTLVENALKHGLEPCAPGGEICLSARPEAACLVLTVADTGRGVSDIPGTGVGLDNIRTRLKLRYGSAACLELEENQPQGFVARITLPMVSQPERVLA
ncbi:hypothetical protein GCM10007907_31990 [Chitinimonas prasina]|uniref:histidine kinase n=1 Tax=Chitinimonas prasina TaxID=1434937 RepID=A0ABQ5YID5_9NEIS|nr:histidine kinase [Chitinimonas prasina]GLR14409.1 hypothetical protein GCM10007907_31990 [Chitinimonas prasina]